ncbi:hypothetical protein BH10PSE14_BH10PSE14_06640 [soil metagenome]
MKVQCTHCGTDINRSPWRINRAGKNGPLAGTVFCNRECQKLHFRFQHRCCWPGCEGMSLVTSQRHRLKQHSSFVCEAHKELMRSRLGHATAFTLARRKFLAGEPLGHRRATGKFVRFVVLELAGGECAGCNVALDPAAYYVDHKVPIFEGGATGLSNLQPLCRPCHLKKTAAEQRRVNSSRWSKDRSDANVRNMTHVEKDALILQLIAENFALTERLRAQNDDAAPYCSGRGNKSRRG